MEEFQTPEETDWSKYYLDAEAHAEMQFRNIFSQELDKFNLSVVLDFACGHGRIAQFFRPIVGQLILCDVNQEAIEYCKLRFGRSESIEYLLNTEVLPVENDSITFLYSWDAMVHFDKARIAHYFKEFSRVMMPGGYAMIHHSNLGNTGQHWQKNIHCRENVSAKNVRDICEDLGLEIISQKIIDWGVPKLDCITTFRKP